MNHRQTLARMGGATLLLVIALVAATPAAGAAAEAGEGVLVLRGLDPVSLVEGEELPGRDDLSAEHRGFLYRFASAEHREAFLADPGRYAVQGDRCTAMPQARGNPEIFAVHESKIYLFGTPGCREDFLASPAAFLDTVTPRKVAVLLYDGVELLDFAGPGEVFAAAASHRGFEVFTVAASREPILSQGFVTVVPEHSFADAPRPDVLVLPGGAVGALINDEKTMDWIVDTVERAEVVMTVCTGAFVLAEAGLLDGLEATTHHGALEGLRLAAPYTEVREGRRYVDNGKIITAAGVSAGIDAALHVVARLLTPEAADRTATYMAYEWNRDAGAGQRLASAGADAD